MIFFLKTDLVNFNKYMQNVLNCKRNIESRVLQIACILDEMYSRLYASFQKVSRLKQDRNEHYVKN